jgi:hypothetical protein
MPAGVIGLEVEPNPNRAPDDPNKMTPDGTLYYLVEGPIGPTRGSGFDYALSYSYQLLGGVPIGMSFFAFPNAGAGFGLNYSACPRRWNHGTGTMPLSKLAPF